MSNPVFPLFSLLVSGMLLIPCIGVAQMSPPETLAGISLPEVTVTASRQEQASFDAPRAVTIIGQEEIERRAPVVLPDLLRGEAGVFVQQTTPGQGSPIIRGLLGSSVLMLVDGMRLNNAFFRPAPNQYFALIDPYHVERLEVVRGAGSALYGSDAMGGVVNVLTRVPRFDTDEWQLHGRTIGQFASAETAGITRFSINGGKRGIAASAGFTYQNRDDLRAGSGTQRPSGFDVYAANGTLVLDRDQHPLFLNVQYFRQPETPRYDELVAGFGETEPSAAVFLFEPNDRLFIHARYTFSPMHPLLDRFELHMAYQEINDDRRTRDLGSLIEGREDNRSRLVGITTQFTAHWRDIFLLTYGSEIYLDRITSRRFGDNIETHEKSRLQSRFANGSKMDSFAGYVHTELWLHPKLTTVLGGRYSYFDIDIPRADRDVGVRLGLDDLTGQAGVMYHLTPALNLVANVGRGFRVPNVFDFSTLGPRPGNRFNIPNADLKPESVLSVDFGLKWSTSRFRAEAFGFHSRFEDKITAVPTGEFTPEGRQIVRSENLNSVKFWGAEAAGSFRVTDEWNLFASFTYTWAEEKFRDDETAPADRIPPANGRIGCLYAARGPWWAEGFVRFATEQDRLSGRDRRDPRINPTGTPGWVTANLT